MAHGFTRTKKAHARVVGPLYDDMVSLEGVPGRQGRRADDCGGISLDYNLATINEAIAQAIGDREAIIFRDRRFTYADFTRRTRRLANIFIEHGLGCHTERPALDGWRSGQDHLGIYLYNGNEFLEGMLGAYKARVAPFNVNYRYVDEELVYLLNNAKTRALLYHSSLSEHVRHVRDQVPSLELLIQVNDEPAPLLEGALEHETALPGPARRSPTANGHRTISTSCTPGEPRACRRVCYGARATF